MHVLHVIPSIAPRYGGPSAAIAPMCQALLARGINPLIATTDADGSGRLPVPLGRPTTWEGVPAIFFSRNISESFKYSLGLSRWLAANVSAFDLVHVHALMSHASLAASTAARRAHVPYIIRPLGTIAPWSLQQKSLRKRALLALGARQLLHDAAAVHCTSAQEKQDVERAIGVSTCVVVPLGIDPAVLEEEPVSFSEREKDPYCLTLSRLHPKKNLETVIDAFLDATEQSQEWRLLIAGDGEPEYVARLRHHISERRAEDRISLLGWVEGPRKRDLIRESSIFVLASLHENFGISLLEALGRGVPVIASRQVDLADAVEAAGAGWIVDTTRPSVTDGIARAVNDAEARRRKSDAARRMAQRYAWPAIADQLVDLYVQIANSRVTHGAAFSPQVSHRSADDHATVPSLSTPSRQSLPK